MVGAHTRFYPVNDGESRGVGRDCKQFTIACLVHPHLRLSVRRGLPTVAINWEWGANEGSLGVTVGANTDKGNSPAWPEAGRLW